MFTRRTTFKAVTSVTLAITFATAPVFGWLGELQPQQQACASCAGETSVALLDSAARVARDSVPLTVVPVILTPHDGIPFQYVESATGHVAFSVVDLEFQCQVPIALMRYYNSGRSRVQSGLGAGWSLLLDDQVEVEGAAARLRSAGETVAMRLDARGGAFEPIDPAGTYHQPLRRADDGTLREQMGDATRVYAPDGGVYRLVRTEHGELGSVQISRDRRGKITSLAASDNPCTINLKWSAGAQPRLLAATDNTGRSVTYAYEGDRLSGVTDVAGSPWHYFYEGAGALVRVVDPEGTAPLRVTYSGGRAATSETIDGLAQFSYQRNGNILNPTVTLPQDEVAVVHNDFGQVVSVKSKAGASTAMTYDAGRRLVAVDGPGPLRQRHGYDDKDRRVFSSVNGKVTRWEYDSAGRLARRFDGTNWMRFSYPDNQTVTVSSPIARLNSKSTYESGRLVRTVGAAGVETFEYDRLGKIATYTDLKGQITFDNDAHGWLRRLGLPDGSIVESTFDARGAIIGSRESSGRSLTYERDRRGALVAVTASDGGWVRATRDKDGRVVRLTNSRNQSRVFSYDAAGRIATYTNALGQVFRMQFDKQGAPARLAQEGLSRTSTKPFRPAPRRANSGAQARTANLDVDDWYDPDNPEGVLGSFQQIRGARGTGKGRGPEPSAGVSGPVDSSTDSLESALLCEQNNCAACRAAAVNACTAGARDCRRRASLVFYICVVACGTVAPTVVLYFVCTALCAANKSQTVSNCTGAFNTCKLTIPGQCASVCQ